MEVAKTFDRDGVRYRPGDTLPEGLDKQALEHYKRHGMVREAKPSETKPTAQRRSSAKEPKNTKPAGPANTTGAGQALLDQGTVQTATATASDPQPESKAVADSAVDDASASGAADQAATAWVPQPESEAAAGSAADDASASGAADQTEA